MTTEVLPPDHQLREAALVTIDRAALIQHQAYWRDALAQLEALEADTPEMEQWMANCLTAVQAAYTDLEAERMALKRPLLDDGKLVDDAYRIACQPALAYKAAITTKLAAAAKARRVAAEVLRLEAAALAASGDTAGCQAALARTEDNTKIAGVSERETWKWCLDDLRLVPIEYMMVEPKTIARHIREAKGDPAPIPGIRFFKETTVQPTGSRKT